ELFRKPANSPREPPSPGAEWRVALLGIGAAIAPVVGVENALVGHSTADVISVTAFTVINAVTGGDGRVFEQALEQGNLLVLLAHEHMAKPMRHRQRAQRAHRVDEQRMRAVERVNESSPM